MDQVITGMITCKNVGDIKLVSAKEEYRIRNLHDTNWPVVHRPAYRLLQDTGLMAPKSIAVISCDRTLTYAELNEEANAVGHVLASAGAAPESIVGVLAKRDSYAYVMRQGVLKSGGAFLPIDPDYPEDRVLYILADSGAKIVLTGQGVKEKRPELFQSIERQNVRIILTEDALENGSRDDLNVEVSDEAPAYVILSLVMLAAYIVCCIPMNVSAQNTDGIPRGHWVDETETVHHGAEGHYEDVQVGTKTVVDKEAWDEPVYEWFHMCNECGEVFDNDDAASHIAKR